MTTEQIIEAIAHYPELIQLMTNYRKMPKPNRVNLIRDKQIGKKMLSEYKKFLNFKDKMPEKEFYEKYMSGKFHSETITSPTFGTKTFYKSDIPVMYWDIFVTIEPKNWRAN